MSIRPTLLAASILSADFACLGEEVNQVLAAGADWIHVDVMDQHFVPNLTMGPMICEALRQFGITALLDVHLMVSPVEMLIERFAQAGANALTIHPEACIHLHRALQHIKKLGCKAGVALNPSTPLSVVLPILPFVDQLLLMSVNPGFGGQTFIPESLERISALRQMIDDSGRSILLCVDGGIGKSNMKSVVDAGADVLIMGSAIFESSNYAQTILEFRQLLR